MDAPLALYRRYRPETYAEVIGQDHVTEPLRQALRNNRVNHAYLFSGPRGCGKTTSARILARCLNCAEGPTPDPCGRCQSCVDLARGGSGSIDVIEIDAASHGGVDDARDLRERAFFSPVSARYKIYIVDEAHMVTTQGFNALLKLVEEPPEHLKFIFATTEPDKVIGTIRSRTHHYPFRLVPPKLLTDYLADLCGREGVPIDPAALPLVVRAGGGSVRDTLSILDQLIGGAAADGVSYTEAVGLLGYTPDTLLDDVVAGLAAGDGAAVFAAIDRVIESGQDPKRFAEDLLQRLRDLIVVAAVPDAIERGLLDGLADQSERFTAQAASMGRAELTRAADVINTGLTEMRGATAPRLHLELMCARVLLPGADDSELGAQARLDRLERRMSIQGAPAAQPAQQPPAQQAQPQRAQPQQAQPTPPAAPATPAPSEPAPSEPAPSEPASGTTTAPPEAVAAASAEVPAPSPSDQPAPEQPAPDQTAPPQPPPAQPAPAHPAGSAGAAEPVPAQEAPPAPTPAPPAPGAELGLVEVRRVWPDILEAVKNKRRFTWIMLSQNAHVTDVRNGTLTLGLVNAGARDSFLRSKSDELLQEALSEVLGVSWRVDAVVDPSSGGGSGRSGGGGGGGSAPPPAGPPPSAPPADAPGPAEEPAGPAEWPAAATPPGSATPPAGEPQSATPSATPPAAPPGTPPTATSPPADPPPPVPPAAQAPPAPAPQAPPESPPPLAEPTPPPPPLDEPPPVDGPPPIDEPPPVDEPDFVAPADANAPAPADGFSDPYSDPDPGRYTDAYPDDPDYVDPDSDAAYGEAPLRQAELLKQELGAKLIDEPRRG